MQPANNIATASAQSRNPSHANTAQWRWRILDAGPLALDGGSMFGVIPRIIWAKSFPPDDRNRIHMRHVCLLLQSTTDPARNVLIEAGSGDKFDAKNRDIFGLSERCISTALAEVAVDPQTISDVIISHLHFDHAGGLTRRCRPGESPDWSDPDYPAGVKLTFPRARVHLQKREWLDALDSNSAMTRTFFHDNLLPLRDQLTLHESPAPFPAGARINRNELPKSSAASRMIDLLPGIKSLLVPGHTWGQQAVVFTDDQNRTVVFTPDVMPTVHHLGAAYNLAYDVEPYISMLSRHWFLDEAARNNWLLVLSHETGNPVQRARANSHAWFDLIPENQPENPGAARG